MDQRSDDRGLLAHTLRESPYRFVSIFPAAKQFQIFRNLGLGIFLRKAVQPSKKKDVLPPGKLLDKARRSGEAADSTTQVLHVVVYRTTGHDRDSDTGRQQTV